jgi:hypothetical protein
MLFANLNQKPFETRHGPFCKPDSLAHFKKRVRLSQKASSYRPLDGSDFSIGDRHRDSSYTHKTHNPRNGQKGKPKLGIRSTKNVAGKKRKLYHFKAIRPTTAGLIERQKLLKSLVSSYCRDDFLRARLHTQGEPRICD